MNPNSWMDLTNVSIDTREQIIYAMHEDINGVGNCQIFAAAINTLELDSRWERNKIKPEKKKLRLTKRKHFRIKSQTSESYNVFNKTTQKEVIHNE